jgi:hypothetical protein
LDNNQQQLEFALYYFYLTIIPKSVFQSKQIELIQQHKVDTLHRPCTPSLFAQQLKWETFCNGRIHRTVFRRHILHVVQQVT